jgi:tRNA-splicing ligase RtcB
MKLKITAKELRAMGYPESKVIPIAMDVMMKQYKHTNADDAFSLLKNVLEEPQHYYDDEHLGKIAHTLLPLEIKENTTIQLMEKGAPFTIYGEEAIEQGAMHQMHQASKLPISVASALMPDAHSGYGLPIGGVLATRNAIIPYGVGVDIGCRMCLSIYDLPAHDLINRDKFFMRELQANTLFGSGREFDQCFQHEVIDRVEFSETKLLKSLQKKAARQLGSSGSGNHFVEFGIVNIEHENNELHIPAGEYIGLLSHSGSRGMGASIAKEYTNIAKQVCKLPGEAQNLAWLTMDTEAGIEYWRAMNLAGDYASACHDVIHQRMTKVLGRRAIARVENHHNFAWKEMWNNEEVIVHRKGATPAGKGVLGIIPGSMATPGFIVSGKGVANSLQSASHGAGRLMSRTKAKNCVTKNALNDLLKKNGVTLLGGGLDEAPHAYKNIYEVMKLQQDLVNIVGTFMPKIVKMDE